MRYGFKGLLIVTMMMSAATLMAARPQQREVVIDTVCQAPLKDILKVTDRFCYQFQACPDSLFDWAYKGLQEIETDQPKTKESRSAIQLRYKDRVYDAQLKTGDVSVDIYVLGVRWWKDQHLGTKYTLTRPAGAKYPLTAHLKATYSGSLLEGGDIIFHLEPISPTRTRVHYEFSISFGRVLSTFISDKIWRNAIEWRFETILDNIIEYTETGTVQKREVGPKK